MNDQPWDTSAFPEPALPLDRTFEGYLELEWLELTERSAHVRFEVRDGLKQPLGLLHGGIYCSVAETVASVATVKQVWANGLTASGMSNSANFLRPVTGGSVDVIAQLRMRGETEWFWSHQFRDDEERLCAVVDVMIAVRPRQRD